jgi:hypothetical protein
MSLLKSDSVFFKEIIIITYGRPSVGQLPPQACFRHYTNFLKLTGCRFDFLPTLQIRKLRVRNIEEDVQSYYLSMAVLRLGIWPFFFGFYSAYFPLWLTVTQIAQV